MALQAAVQPVYVYDVQQQYKKCDQGFAQWQFCKSSSH